MESVSWSGKTTKTTMQKKLWKMILIVTIPLMLIIILVVGVALGYGLQYNSILNNVTTASDFNREFTDNIKTKMYYFVIDSQYSEGMPTEEVKSAEAIAKKIGISQVQVSRMEKKILNKLRKNANTKEN